MFGIAPLLRGLLTLVEVALVLAVIGGVLTLLLRLVGIDLRDVQAYQRQRRAYDDGLRRLHVQIAQAEAESDLLYAAAMLRDYQAQAPTPPRWAFWLKAGQAPRS